MSLRLSGSSTKLDVSSQGDWQREETKCQSSPPSFQFAETSRLRLTSSMLRKTHSELCAVFVAKCS